MRFPWHRRADEAYEAAMKAKKEYERIRAQRPRVDAISKMVREQRELNHFADAFRKIIGE